MARSLVIIIGMVCSVGTQLSESESPNAVVRCSVDSCLDLFQDSTDDVNWVKAGAGHSPTQALYLSQPTSKGGNSGNVTIGRLASRFVDNGNGDLCVQFYCKVNVAGERGVIDVMTKRGGHFYPDSDKRPRVQCNSTEWKLHHMVLSARKPSGQFISPRYQVVFEGRVPNNRGIVMGVDDILVLRGTCPIEDTTTVDASTTTTPAATPTTLWTTTSASTISTPTPSRTSSTTQTSSSRATTSTTQASSSSSSTIVTTTTSSTTQTSSLSTATPTRSTTQTQTTTTTTTTPTPSMPTIAPTATRLTLPTSQRNITQTSRTTTTITAETSTPPKTAAAKTSTPASTSSTILQTNITQTSTTTSTRTRTTSAKTSTPPPTTTTTTTTKTSKPPLPPTTTTAKTSSPPPPSTTTTVMPSTSTHSRPEQTAPPPAATESPSWTMMTSEETSDTTELRDTAGPSSDFTISTSSSARNLSTPTPPAATVPTTTFRISSAATATTRTTSTISGTTSLPTSVLTTSTSQRGPRLSASFSTAGWLSVSTRESRVSNESSSRSTRLALTSSVPLSSGKAQRTLSSTATERSSSGPETVASSVIDTVVKSTSTSEAASTSTSISAPVTTSTPAPVTTPASASTSVTTSNSTAVTTSNSTSVTTSTPTPVTTPASASTSVTTSNSTSVTTSNSTSVTTSKSSPVASPSSTSISTPLNTSTSTTVPPGSHDLATAEASFSDSTPPVPKRPHGSPSPEAETTAELVAPSQTGSEASRTASSVTARTTIPGNPQSSFNASQTTSAVSRTSSNDSSQSSLNVSGTTSAVWRTSSNDSPQSSLNVSGTTSAFSRSVSDVSRTASDVSPSSVPSDVSRTSSVVSTSDPDVGRTAVITNSDFSTTGVLREEGSGLAAKMPDSEKEALVVSTAVLASLLLLTLLLTTLLLCYRWRRKKKKKRRLHPPLDEETVMTYEMTGAHNAHLEMTEDANSRDFFPHKHDSMYSRPWSWGTSIPAIIVSDHSDNDNDNDNDTDDDDGGDYEVAASIRSPNGDALSGEGSVNHLYTQTGSYTTNGPHTPTSPGNFTSWSSEGVKCGGSPQGLSTVSQRLSKPMYLHRDPRSENRPQHPAPPRPSSLSLSSSSRPDPPHERSAFTAVVSISGAAVSSRTITTSSPASASPNSLARTSYDGYISNSSSSNNSGSSSSSRLLTQQAPARTMLASGREAGPGVCDLQPHNQADGSNSYQHRQRQTPATGGDNVLYAKVVKSGALVRPVLRQAKPSPNSRDAELSTDTFPPATGLEHGADGDPLSECVGRVPVRYPGFSTTAGFGAGLSEEGLAGSGRGGGRGGGGDGSLLPKSSHASVTAGLGGGLADGEGRRGGRGEGPLLPKSSHAPVTAGLGGGLADGGGRGGRGGGVGEGLLLPKSSHVPAGQLKFVHTRLHRGGIAHDVPLSRRTGDLAADRGDGRNSRNDAEADADAAAAASALRKDHQPAVAGDANGSRLRPFSVTSDLPRLAQKFPAYAIDKRDRPSRSETDAQRIVAQAGGGPIRATTPASPPSGAGESCSQVPASRASPSKALAPEVSRARGSLEGSASLSTARGLLLRDDYDDDDGNNSPCLSRGGGAGSSLGEARAVGNGLPGEARSGAGGDNGRPGPRALTGSRSGVSQSQGEVSGLAVPAESSNEAALSSKTRTDVGRDAARRVSNGIPRDGLTVDVFPAGESLLEAVPLSQKTLSDHGQAQAAAAKVVPNSLPRDGLSVDGESHLEDGLFQETLSDDGHTQDAAAKLVPNGLARDGRLAAADARSVDGRYLRSPRRNRRARVERRGAQNGNNRTSVNDGSTPPAAVHSSLLVSAGDNGGHAAAAVAPETAAGATAIVTGNHGPGHGEIMTSATTTSQSRPLSFVSKTAGCAENDQSSDDKSSDSEDLINTVYNERFGPLQVSDV